MSDVWTLLLALAVIVAPMALAWVLLGRGDRRGKPRREAKPWRRP
jgi:hypothetical protein